MSEQPRPTRAFPVWAVVLVAVVAAVLVAGAVLGITVLRTTSAEGAVRDVCVEAVRTKLGTGVSDVDVTTYPPVVQRTGGSVSDGTYRVQGEVDFRRGGEANRGYYSCEARRSGGTTTVSGVTVV